MKASWAPNIHNTPRTNSQLKEEVPRSHDAPRGLAGRFPRLPHLCDLSILGKVMRFTCTKGQGQDLPLGTAASLGFVEPWYVAYTAHAQSKDSDDNFVGSTCKRGQHEGTRGIAALFSLSDNTPKPSTKETPTLAGTC